ncbi:MAG: DUF819 family protein [Flavobacteriales bacterium]|nr:DUF819 family protein [Flavobacteriales bacterium]
MEHTLITNDAIVLGVLLAILALVFITSSSKNRFLVKFYTYVPALLLCYFLPALLNTFNIVDGEESKLYFVSSRYLLPASLVLLCLSVDLKAIINLGPKAVIMFFTATIGIILGGPTALYLIGQIHPEVFGGDGPEAFWRGLSTISGSWIGGGANQTALKEISNTTEAQFSIMLLVDVFVANIWMAFLLFGASRSKKLDRKLKADTTAIEALKEKVENYQSSIAKVANFNDLIIMLTIAFGCVALGHLTADLVAPFFANTFAAIRETNPDSPIIYLSSLGTGFFWLVLMATILGVALSFTPLRKYEGAGASKLGSVFLYILVASIGLHINFKEVYENWTDIQWVIYIGLLWMVVHIIILLVVAKLIKAPFFFVAVGSQANVGGAASAPIVASAFSPTLAPVGVLLAVLGYAVGTIGAIICMELMHVISM